MLALVGSIDSIRWSSFKAEKLIKLIGWILKLVFPRNFPKKIFTKTFLTTINYFSMHKEWKSCFHKEWSKQTDGRFVLRRTKSNFLSQIHPLSSVQITLICLIEISQQPRGNFIYFYMIQFKSYVFFEKINSTVSIRNEPHSRNPPKMCTFYLWTKPT